MMRADFETAVVAIIGLALFALFCALCGCSRAEPPAREAFAAVDDRMVQTLGDPLKEEIDRETAREMASDGGQGRIEYSLSANEIDSAVPFALKTTVDSEIDQTAPHTGFSTTVDAGGFKEQGVVYGEDGTRFTWYSQRVLPGGGLDIPGRHVTEDGFVADSEGRIAVASSDLPAGTEVDTPFGEARVYDTGCASGTIDVYTDW